MAMEAASRMNATQASQMSLRAESFILEPPLAVALNVMVDPMILVTIVLQQAFTYDHQSSWLAMLANHSDSRCLHMRNVSR